VHLLADQLALIRRPPLRTGGHGVMADVCTTLLPAMPKLMLNYQSGDYGMLERRDCVCPLHDTGLDPHMHTIRSWGKLTSEALMVGLVDLIGLVE
jgi:hypothetical protein